MEGKGALTFLLVRIFYVRLRMLDIHMDIVEEFQPTYIL
jgi:hypothetical protein